MSTITIVLTERYSDWEIGVLIGTGRAFYDADIRFVSPDGKGVTSVGGLDVGGLGRFVAPEAGVVVVCGGPMFESDAPPAIEAELRSAFDKGCAVAGICGGTLALARAGLLDDVRHTSNGAKYLAQVLRYRGQGFYVDQPAAVSDGRIITAPAPAPASFAQEVLMASGVPAEAAGQVMGLLGMEHTRAGS